MHASRSSSSSEGGDEKSLLFWLGRMLSAPSHATAAVADEPHAAGEAEALEHQQQSVTSNSSTNTTNTNTNTTAVAMSVSTTSIVALEEVGSSALHTSSTSALSAHAITVTAVEVSSSNSGTAVAAAQSSRQIEKVEIVETDVGRNRREHHHQIVSKRGRSPSSQAREDRSGAHDGNEDSSLTPQPQQLQLVPQHQESGRRRTVLRDAMPLMDHILSGQVGPVAVDVQVLGQASLLLDPIGFDAIMESHASASSEPLRTLHASIKPFFALRGNSFYTVDNAVYPVLPLLAALLKSPHVTKIIANASLLYRLLFLFLGTDRIDIANVVDVEVWGRAVQQRYAPQQTYSVTINNRGNGVAGEADAAATSTVAAVDPAVPGFNGGGGVCQVSAASLLAGISTAAREQLLNAFECIDDSVGNRNNSGLASVNESAAVITKSRSDVPPLPLPMMAAAAEEVDEDSAGHENNVTATLLSDRVASSSSLALLQPPTPPPLQEAAPAAAPPLQQRTTTRAAPALAAMRPLLQALGASFLYYEERIHPSAYTAGVALPAGVTHGSSTLPTHTIMSVADVCARRSYAVFLCQAMRFHGLVVRKQLFDQFMQDLAQQMSELSRIGAAHAEALQITSLSPSDWPAITARRLCDAVMAGAPHATRQRVAQHLSSKNMSMDGNASMAATAATAFVKELREALVQQHGQQQRACLCAVWLAWRERQQYQETLQSSLRNIGSHLRVSVRRAAADDDCMDHGDATTDNSNSGQHQLQYTVHPTWSVHLHSTNRIFGSQPNLQHLPKEPPMAQFSVVSTSEHPVASEESADEAGHNYSRVSVLLQPCRMFCGEPSWTQRHLYAAPPHCTLVSFDYNQIELRVLAHLCGDALLRQHLNTGVDVLALLARAACGIPAGGAVTSEQRQAVKVVVYGLLYGMGQKLLDIKLANMNLLQANQHQQEGAGSGTSASASASAAAAPSAQTFMKAVYDVYPCIPSYLRNTRMTAFHDKRVRTLSGLQDLSIEMDANRRKQSSVAWAVQGGAADLLHAAMRAVHRGRHSAAAPMPVAPFALVMAVHDELIYAVTDAAVPFVVPFIRKMMEEQGVPFGLSVGLEVSVRMGPSLGELVKVDEM